MMKIDIVLKLDVKVVAHSEAVQNTSTTSKLSILDHITYLKSELPSNNSYWKTAFLQFSVILGVFVKPPPEKALFCYWVAPKLLTTKRSKIRHIRSKIIKNAPLKMFVFWENKIQHWNNPRKTSWDFQRDSHQTETSRMKHTHKCL